jgi:hypothetical protein
MALQDLDLMVQQMYRDEYDHLKQTIGNTEYTEFDISPSIFGDAMMRSFTRAVEGAIPPQQLKNNPSYRNNLTERVAQVNTLVSWKNAMKDHHSTMKGRPVSGYENYPKAKDLGNGMILLSNDGVGSIKVLHSPEATVSYDTWYNNYKDAVWNIWKTNYGSAFTGGSGRRGGYDYKQTKTGGVSQEKKQAGQYPDATKDEYFAVATHDPSRTIPLAEFALNLPDTLSPHVTFQGQEGDLVKTFLANHKIQWKEEQVGTTPSGMPILVRKLIIIPGMPNPVGPYDLKTRTTGGKRYVGGAWSTLRSEFKAFLWENFDFTNPQVAADIEASPTFRQQAAAAAQYAIVRELMKKNAKRIVKKKIKTKEPKKKKPRQKTYKSPVKKNRKSVIIAMKGKVSKAKSKGIEKGQGKQASTSQAADLTRLKKYIQGRLPAEVRRNMRRPALQNRTGRFSNSVQLLSLTEAQNTIMAKYTYLLSPYQTFENTGKKRWPMAYNPKPLIAKSIRNLAQGRIEQKLTVRRV